MHKNFKKYLKITVFVAILSLSGAPRLFASANEGTGLLQQTIAVAEKATGAANAAQARAEELQAKTKQIEEDLARTKTSLNTTAENAALTIGKKVSDAKSEIQNIINDVPEIARSTATEAAEKVTQAYQSLVQKTLAECQGAELRGTIAATKAQKAQTDAEDAKKTAQHSATAALESEQKSAEIQESVIATNAQMETQLTDNKKAHEARIDQLVRDFTAKREELEKALERADAEHKETVRQEIEKQKKDFETKRAEDQATFLEQQKHVQRDAEARQKQAQLEAEARKLEADITAETRRLQNIQTEEEIKANAAKARENDILEFEKRKEQEITKFQRERDVAANQIRLESIAKEEELRLQARSTPEFLEHEQRLAETQAKANLPNAIAASIAAATATEAMKERAENERHKKQLVEENERHKKTLELDGEKHKQRIQADKEMNEARLNFYGQTLRNLGEGFTNLTNDHTRLAKLCGALVATAAGIYLAKHGIPHLVDYLVQPRVVSETSKRSLFGWTGPHGQAEVEDLTFTPELQASLLEIATQLKTARVHDENIPNVLFSGPPGTGKTAFAKAIARMKDKDGNTLFDYALTSGSEFAKIKDLNIAIEELRKLIRWGQKSSKPIIIFIDEAESLFTNRTLPGTSKAATDFINAFLAMVQDKSQKNVCFIFATNHPFKLDDAIINRVGKKVVFTLPKEAELKKILSHYVTKFAKAKKNAVVELSPQFTANVDTYAKELIGCAPRDVKFVAEQMVIMARRNKPALLTPEIAEKALKEAKQELATTAQWAKERDAWMRLQVAATA